MARFTPAANTSGSGGDFTFSAGVKFAYTAFSSGPQTLTSAHHIVECTTGTFTVNLPAASDNTGREYIIKNSGTGVITVDPNASETIDGLTTYVLAVKGDSIDLICNGTNWIIV